MRNWKTEIDSSFATAEFKIEDYTKYELNKYSNGQSILLYVRESIPLYIFHTVECWIIYRRFLHWNKYKKKEMAFSLHLQFKQKYNFKPFYSSKYDNFIRFGDLNSKTTKSVVR